MPVLKVEELCIRFGGVVAADHVSFEVNPGEIVGLIGPNGAGKSTTLNLISGIYKCDSGKVYLNDKDVTDVSSHERARMGLSRTFQTPHFLKRSTIRENMLLGTDLADQVGYFRSFLGQKKSNFDAEVAQLLKIANLTIDWSVDISSIPYGQQKRLEIVRGLLAHPKVILVDEPAAGLNTKEMEYVVALLHHAVAQGVGVVLIEHQMDLIMNVCHRIVVLNFGKVIGCGTPAEVSSNEDVIEAYLGRKA